LAAIDASAPSSWQRRLSSVSVKWLLAALLAIMRKGSGEWHWAIKKRGRVGPAGPRLMLEKASL
jgi:hypothetical protein